MIRKIRKQSGTVSVEYALMISLTAIGLIVAIGLMTGEMSNLFASIKTSVGDIKEVVNTQIENLIFNIGATDMPEAAYKAADDTDLDLSGVGANAKQVINDNGTITVKGDGGSGTLTPVPNNAGKYTWALD